MFPPKWRFQNNHKILDLPWKYFFPCMQVYTVQGLKATCCQLWVDVWCVCSGVDLVPLPMQQPQRPQQHLQLLLQPLQLLSPHWWHSLLGLCVVYCSLSASAGGTRRDMAISQYQTHKNNSKQLKMDQWNKVRKLSWKGVWHIDQLNSDIQ